ncbi:MAG TPA: hypothetical protein VGR47_06000 [Terracidiphilus sp.]|nr:hypothetical protein [Terracidiphilus sp.]
MQVKAIRDCFVGGTLRRKGEEFTHDGSKNRHLEPLEPAPAAAEPKSGGTKPKPAPATPVAE